jgi:DNA-directed RNA polymerase III subunit RPC4
MPGPRGTARGGRPSNPRGRRLTSAAGANTRAASTTASKPAEGDASQIPDPNNSNLPADANSQGNPGSPKAVSAPSTSRFRPKNVRRAEAERDLIAQQELSKEQERNAEDSRQRRTQFRRRRGRGDAMGSTVRRTTTASGPFSQLANAGESQHFRYSTQSNLLVASSSSTRSAGRGGGGWVVGGSSSKFKSAFKSDGDSKYQQAFAEGSDDRDDIPRINADRLNVSLPEDYIIDPRDEAMLNYLRSQTDQVWPMGIYREEHKEPEVVVATTAELEAQENEELGEHESLWVDGLDEQENSDSKSDDPAEEKVWKIDTRQKQIVKPEPHSDHAATLGGSIESKRRRPQLNEEEKMTLADRQLLLSELIPNSQTEQGTDNAEADGQPDKEGRLYLFQFPPLMPPLQPIFEAELQPAVKKESDDVVSLSELPAEPSHVDLTVEDGAKKGTGSPSAAAKTHLAGFSPSDLPNGGFVGKLNVRKSGKVEIDWGGQTFELSPALNAQFLTQAVIVDEKDEKPRPDVVGGECLAMGKVMGRFVVAPIWGEEEEWDIPREDLQYD